MNYKDEAFLHMRLALLPGTVLEDCVFEDCLLITFDDNSVIAKGNCRFVRNNIIQIQKVL